MCRTSKTTAVKIMKYTELFMELCGFHSGLAISREGSVTMHMELQPSKYCETWGLILQRSFCGGYCSIFFGTSLAMKQQVI